MYYREKKKFINRRIKDENYILFILHILPQCLAFVVALRAGVNHSLLRSHLPLWSPNIPTS